MATLISVISFALPLVSPSIEAAVSKIESTPVPVTVTITPVIAAQPNQATLTPTVVEFFSADQLTNPLRPTATIVYISVPAVSAAVAPNTRPPASAPSILDFVSISPPRPTVPSVSPISFSQIPSTPRVSAIPVGQIPVDPPRPSSIPSSQTPITPSAEGIQPQPPMAAATMPMSPSGAEMGSTAMPGSQINTAQLAPAPDPANGAFHGGVPVPNVDVPVTAVFLVLFAAGAFTHISIYKRNAKRGHKFLLSDLVFDFCMIRIVTCIFRIVWAFVATRGVILVSLIVENGGSVVLFAVNIFFVQRIVRSVHPVVGWHPVFSITTLVLLLSVPSVIILNLVALSVSFFSVGNLDRLNATRIVLEFGSSWNVFLSVIPLLVLGVALSVPGAPPEPFGTGPLRVKVSMLLFSSLLLAVGAVIRLYTLVNPEMPGTTSTIFSREVFYITGFMMEMIVVILYAVARVDLLFHVPNGASGPGDYSKVKGDVFAFESKAGQSFEDNEMDEYEVESAELPQRPRRVTRRESLIEALGPRRPVRYSLHSIYET